MVAASSAMEEGSRPVGQGLAKAAGRLEETTRRVGPPMVGAASCLAQRPGWLGRLGYPLEQRLGELEQRMEPGMGQAVEQGPVAIEESRQPPQVGWSQENSGAFDQRDGRRACCPSRGTRRSPLHSSGQYRQTTWRTSPSWTWWPRQRRQKRMP